MRVGCTDISITPGNATLAPCQCPFFLPWMTCTSSGARNADISCLLTWQMRRARATGVSRRRLRRSRATSTWPRRPIAHRPPPASRPHRPSRPRKPPTGTRPSVTRCVLHSFAAVELLHCAVLARKVWATPVAGGNRNLKRWARENMSDINKPCCVSCCKRNY